MVNLIPLGEDWQQLRAAASWGGAEHSIHRRADTPWDPDPGQGVLFLRGDGRSAPTAPSPRAPLPTEPGSAGQPRAPSPMQQGSPCTPEGGMTWIGGRSKGTGKIMFFSNMKMRTESVRGLVRKQISVFEISPCIFTL